MGSLKRFNLDRIIGKYNLSYLFETGTWKGDSIAYAQKSPFQKIYSSEIIPEIADKARNRFNNKPNIEIITSNSIDALKTNADKIDGNCLFWLDAHFPGAEEGLSGYNDTQQDDIKLPLEKEIEIIASREKKYQDVIIIDDLRIYEDGPFRHGNMPEHIHRPRNRDLAFISQALASTHIIQKSYWDEGYILLLPNTIFPGDFGWRRYWYNFYNTVAKKIY